MCINHTHNGCDCLLDLFIQSSLYFIKRKKYISISYIIEIIIYYLYSKVNIHTVYSGRPISWRYSGFRLALATAVWSDFASTAVIKNNNYWFWQFRYPNSWRVCAQWVGHRWGMCIHKGRPVENRTRCLTSCSGSWFIFFNI